MSTPHSRPREWPALHETSELIGLVYEAATQTDLWPSFFAGLDANVNRRLSTIVVRGFGRTRYVDLDAPEAGFTTLNPARIFETKSLSEASFAMAYVGRELVEDWSQLRPAVQDARGPDGKPPSAVEVFAEQSSFLDPARLEVLRAVLPHLHRALRLHFELQILDSERNALCACLDELSDGVVLLDDEATVIHANRAAGVHFARGSEVTNNDGKLRASRDDEDLDFRQNLRRATRGRTRELRGKRLAGGGTLWVKGLSADRAVVFIGGHRRSDPVAPELLEDAFGITPAEARVGSLFAIGQSLADIATRLDISLHTVRLHLKKIQAKTGAHRQAALVGRLLDALPRVAGPR